MSPNERRIGRDQSDSFKSAGNGPDVSNMAGCRHVRKIQVQQKAWLP